MLRLNHTNYSKCSRDHVATFALFIQYESANRKDVWPSGFSFLRRPTASARLHKSVLSGPRQRSLLSCMAPKPHSGNPRFLQRYQTPLCPE